MNDVIAPPAEGAQPAAPEAAGNISADRLAAMLTADRTSSPAPTPDTNQAPPATPSPEAAGGEETNDPKPGNAPAEPPGSPDGEEPEPGGEGDEGRGIPKMQKRIDEITAKYRGAERERDELKAKLAELEAKVAPETPPAKPAAPAAANGVDPALQAIAARQANAEQIMDWAAANADGATVGDREFSRQEVAQLLVRAQKDYSAATAELTTRQAQLQSVAQGEQARLDAAAVKVYPWHNDPESAEHKLAQEIVHQHPEVLRLPNRLEVLGDLVTGRMARLGKTTTTTKAPPPPDPTITLKPKPKANGAPPPIATGGANRVAADPADKAVQQAREQYHKTGSAADLAAYQTAVARANAGRQ